jgi:hypothetical protein
LAKDKYVDNPSEESLSDKEVGIESKVCLEDILYEWPAKLLQAPRKRKRRRKGQSGKEHSEEVAALGRK